MTLNINGYIVEIKAKRENKEKFTKGDTETFLNELSLSCGDAAKYAELKNLKLTAEFYQTFADDIFNFLNERGVYDK